VTREEAKKRASEYANKLCKNPEQNDIFYFAYLMGHDDLKAKLRDVPWTQEEENAVIDAVHNAEDEKLYDEILRLFKWVKKRIRERGL